MQGSPAVVSHSINVCTGDQELFHNAIKACQPLHSQTNNQELPYNVCTGGEAGTRTAVIGTS